jgi:hypothetical protein
MYIVGKYKIYLHDIQKQVEKQSFGFLSCCTASVNEFNIFQMTPSKTIRTMLISSVFR